MLCGSVCKHATKTCLVLYFMSFLVCILVFVFCLIDDTKSEAVFIVDCIFYFSPFLLQYIVIVKVYHITFTVYQSIFQSISQCII